MLGQIQAGTGEVRRVLSACTFKPRLPGELLRCLRFAMAALCLQLCY